MKCNSRWTKEKECIWLQHLFHKVWGRLATPQEQRLIFKKLEAKNELR